MESLGAPPFHDLIREFVDFLTSDELRNFLSSERIIAEIARAVYRLVFAATEAATQIIEAAHIASTAQVFAPGVSMSQGIGMSTIGPTSRMFAPGIESGDSDESYR